MMELSNRKALIERARSIMSKLSLDAISALKMAERELEEHHKKEDKGE